MSAHRRDFFISSVKCRGLIWEDLQIYRYKGQWTANQYMMLQKLVLKISFCLSSTYKRGRWMGGCSSVKAETVSAITV